MRQTRQAARRKRPPIGGPSSAASAGAGRSHATARAALRRVGPRGPTTPGGIPPERRARRDTPAQAGALPRSLPPADGLKKTAWAGKGARPAWLCRDTCPALAPPPKGGDLPCCAAGAGPCAAATGTPPLPPHAAGRGQTPRRSANVCKRKGPHTSCGPFPFVRLACACPPSQHVYYTTAPPPLSSVAAVPSLRRCRRRALPSSASPGGGREGASLAPQRMAFPFCCGFLGGSLAQDAQRRGADEPPRCLFPHAAGVGVSSRSPVSRVRRAAPRLLLAAVHRAVLHLGRRCSLWQSSTT